jgi:uncharacterized membrane protein (DUF106 family)
MKEHTLTLDQFKLFLSIVLFRLILFYWMVCRQWEDFKLHIMLQIRVHMYRPRHYCGDWLTFGCFAPMIADHNLVKKSFGPMIADHDLVREDKQSLQMICAWLKIWTLSVKLSLMRNVQLMQIYIYIYFLCTT